ncbi:MAG: hypothetical protein ACR2FY_11475 [Pirellulaceae bacterium]
MKSQRSHHKPVNNELAQWLGEHIEQWKPHFPVIGIVAAVVLVGGIVYLFAFSGEDMSSAPSWQAYYAAYGEPKVEDALKTVAEKQKGTLAGRWALLALGDQQLRQATQQLVQNPKQAKDNLKLAAATLEEAAKGASDTALLARVHTSLAKVSESGNKLDEARNYYGLVLKDDPEGTFGKAAAKALKRLEKGSDVPELLAWLDKQDLATRPKATGNPFDMGTRREPLPERPDLSIPGEMKLDGPSPFGPSPGRSPLGPDPLGPALPETPLDLKGLPKFDLPKTGVPKTETPKTDTPASEESSTEKSKTEKSKTKSPAVPTPVKPAVPKPVKPAEEEKPGEEKKVDEK